MTDTVSRFDRVFADQLGRPAVNTQVMYETPEMEARRKALENATRQEVVRIECEDCPDAILGVSVDGVDVKLRVDRLFPLRMPDPIEYPELRPGDPRFPNARSVQRGLCTSCRGLRTVLDPNQTKRAIRSRKKVKTQT